MAHRNAKTLRQQYQGRALDFSKLADAREAAVRNAIQANNERLEGQVDFVEEAPDQEDQLGQGSDEPVNPDPVNLDIVEDGRTYWLDDEQ